VRTVAVVLAVIVALVVALERSGSAGPTESRPAATSAEERVAERALTLLDVWAQTLVPSILMQQSRVLALRTGNLEAAARLTRRIRPRLLRAERFATQIARDPALQTAGSVDVHALHDAAVAWRDWAAAVLRAPARSSRHEAQSIARLQARAVGLHQSAYATVDESLRLSVSRM
jgi:hypothetical protein